MLSQHSNRAPLGRTVTAEEVGNVAAFLCSDYASSITGEITYDGGFNIAAMPVDEYESWLKKLMKNMSYQNYWCMLLY